MITLYTWKTPNGRKISIMLEELGEPYKVQTVDLNRNEQFAPAYLLIAPNNKIPAIVDDEAVGGSLPIFESGAILTYLAEKSGQFLATSGGSRYRAIEWLHWSISGLGPAVGQLMFFAVTSEDKVPIAVARFTNEVSRLLGVMEKRLAQVPFLAGDDYSIADIAAYPWVLAASASLNNDDLATSTYRVPALRRWQEAVAVRPAVARGMHIPPA